MAHARRFRFGAELHGPLPGLSWAQSVRRVQELGYSTLFLPDHFSDQLGPIAAMASAALLSDSLNVGSLVFDNDFRHPVVLAKELATVDILAGGRCELGIGAGWKRDDYDRSGIPMESPKVRVERMMEAVLVLKGLFAGEPFSFEGEHYRIDALEGTPRPHTPGGPPMIIAGGSRRMLRFAGRHAAIVGVNPSIHSGAIDADAARDSLADRMDEKVGWVREGAGDRFDDLEINAWVAVAALTDDAVGFADLIAPGFGIAADEAATALESPMVMVGTVDEIAERLEYRRDRWGFSYHVVRDEAVLEMAPVVEALTGR
ncbi:MAG: TIGR03621 family F420-dependent LLM class oxidoreductase [Acidimicrobiales bacterium]